jgi:hypothetical protein
VPAEGHGTAPLSTEYVSPPVIAETLSTGGATVSIGSVAGNSGSHGSGPTTSSNNNHHHHNVVSSHGLPWKMEALLQANIQVTFGSKRTAQYLFYIFQG